MPTYHGSMYLMSDFLSAVQGTQSNTAGIATDTGNLTAIKTSAANLDTPLSGVATSAAAVASQTTSGSSVAATNTAMNNKTLTSVKSSQNAGFVGASNLTSNFTTTSTTFVDTGIDVLNVPNGCKIVYNLWLSVPSSPGLPGSMQIVINSTVIASGNTGAVNNVQLKDYSGNVTNSTGLNGNLSVQILATASSSCFVKGISPNISGVICYNGANAIVYNNINTLLTGTIVAGSCQLTNLSIAVLSSSTRGALVVSGIGISSGNPNFMIFNFPNKQAFPNGLIVAISNGGWVDNDLLLLIDFSGDLLTVN